VGLLVESKSKCPVGSVANLSFADDRDAVRRRFGLVRNVTSCGAWKRVGLSVSPVPYGDLIAVTTRDRILNTPFRDRIHHDLRYLGSAVGAATGRLSRALGVDVGAGAVEVIRYRNSLDQEIVGIADRVGSGSGGLAVVIAPAWGRTKETMLPLAAVLSETFAAAGESALIVRFDGTNRRGESWVDPACRGRGNEYLRFRFSQAVDDIHSTLRFLADSSEFRPSKVILVTASLAAIEGRRAVSTDPLGLIKGWVSLVGMVDLQSGLRAASGGIDYAFGIEAGAKFGRHEVAGVLADMDLTGRDVLDAELGLFEDARRDMARISVPITWIHGRYDGWIELGRVRELMSAGEVRDRRLIEVPTGHQLRSSKQAIETFELVAEEIGRIAFGRRLGSVVPRGRLLAAKSSAERGRRPSSVADLREFWRRYVLGRDGTVGMEILSATAAYRRLMSEQISLLRLSPRDRVLDLGAGAGDFAVAIERSSCAKEVDIVGVDLLPEALKRGRERLVRDSSKIGDVVADLDRGIIPLSSEVFDAVLVSLLLSYLGRPDQLLADVRRVLRPGGRIVVSCPRRDADLSKIYVDGLREFDPLRVRALFGADAEENFESLQRDLLNQGSRLLALEEEGRFQFWDKNELVGLLKQAGFVQVEGSWSFGHPPQVALASGRRT